MRKGSLTDAETLRLYEAGETIVALCLLEGMTAHGMIGRIGRARAWRREHAPLARQRVRHARASPDSLAALEAILAELQRTTTKLKRTPLRSVA